jgi:hypothetical protein
MRLAGFITRIYHDVRSCECQTKQQSFPAVHHTDNTSNMLRIRTHHTTAVHITPQTLNNFNLHYFIIIHSYPTVLHIIIIHKKQFN